MSGIGIQNLREIISDFYLSVRDFIVDRIIAIASGEEADFNNVTVTSGYYIYNAGVLRVHGTLSVEDGGKIILEDGSTLSYVGGY
jgi:hypothetical protein